MGFWSSVGSAISSACSSVCSAVSSFTSTAVNLVREVGNMAVEGLKSVANVICNIAKALGFMQVDEDPEEVGDKIIQAEEMGITLDSCEGDYEKYMENIRNFKVDPEKSKEISEKDKLVACSVVMGAQIEEHYGTSIAPLVPMMARMPEFFNGGRLKSMLDAGLSISKVGDYFNSSLNRKEVASVEADLVKQEAKTAPDSDDAQLRDMLRSMRE
ncbi:hypothetical protein [Moritella sp. Urea-trap-13]|uniref:hypothetical protein n=1 Tax=Moritella sp. Urea-trap-13 TaxID=2058327 RepID=UPI000C32A401|nr:hypothetical protein [Moritella sp. Urea-trap-13]PKH07129.1 hypothetical protein CXF93_14780 [Moritella sp. Urea-trap-13]